MFALQNLFYNIADNIGAMNEDTLNDRLRNQVSRYIHDGCRGIVVLDNLIDLQYEMSEMGLHGPTVRKILGAIAIFKLLSYFIGKFQSSKSTTQKKKLVNEALTNIKTIEQVPGLKKDKDVKNVVKVIESVINEDDDLSKKDKDQLLDKVDIMVESNKKAVKKSSRSKSPHSKSSHSKSSHSKSARSKSPRSKSARSKSPRSKSARSKSPRSKSSHSKSSRSKSSRSKSSHSKPSHSKSSRSKSPRSKSPRSKSPRSKK